VSTDGFDNAIRRNITDPGENISEVRREAALLKTGALQNAIIGSLLIGTAIPRARRSRRSRNSSPSAFVTTSSTPGPCSNPTPTRS
jgi:hypothetical protein